VGISTRTPYCSTVCLCLNNSLTHSFVNSETGHSEDRQPNLRYALGSVKRVKVRATVICEPPTLEEWGTGRRSPRI
jgi:hypothetical protein